MLNIKPTDIALSYFKAMKLKEIAYVIYKINKAVIEPEKTVNNTKQYYNYAVDFTAAIQESGTCRWGVIYWNNKLTFVSWCPDRAKAKDKMMYAAARESFSDALIGIEAKVQCTEASELLNYFRVKQKQSIKNMKQVTDSNVRVTKLQSEISRLKTQIEGYKSTENELRTAYQTLSSELNQKQMQTETETAIIQSLRDQIENLQKRNQQLQIQNGKLMEEHKDFELKINELTAENKRLKLKCIDTGNYEQWNHEEILMWIMSLDNGRFAKYEQKLKQSLAEEDVSGVNLREVDVADIKGWGVVNFNDKKYLMKQIQQLVKNIGKNANYLNEGNNAAPTGYI